MVEFRWPKVLKEVAKNSQIRRWRVGGMETTFIHLKIGTCIILMMM